MTNACLIDSNLLVYAYDTSHKPKQETALDLLDHLAVEDIGVLSVQALTEFYSVTTRRIRNVLSHSEARIALFELTESFQVVELTLPILMEATRGVREYQFAFWDSLVWASAKLNQIPIVLTEDMPSANVIEGVRFLDPFDSSPETQAALTSLGLAE